MGLEKSSPASAPDTMQFNIWSGNDIDNSTMDKSKQKKQYQNNEYYAHRQTKE